MANNIQTRTIQINGVDVKYKVTNNLKKIHVLFNDNFATAEGFLSSRSLLSSLLYYREFRSSKRPRICARVNRFCKTNKADATISISLSLESEVVKKIISEIKNERNERKRRKENGI